MFQIGRSLRMVRERRGLALATVEQETRIPARRLTALEEERFDLLPERIYALGFLRTYAEYLGLDPQPYVDELSARLPSEDAYDAPPLLPAASRSRVLRPAIVSAGTLALTAAVVGLLALRSGGGHPRTVISPPARHLTPPQPPATPQRSSRPRPKLATLVLVAARGRCWLEARLGSPRGSELYSGTLEAGSSVRLSGTRVWIRLGAPSALDATLNQRAVVLPTVTPENIVVTESGVQTG